METLLLQERGHLLGVVEEAHADGDDDHLARGHPEGPLAGKVFCQDGGETLNATSHGAVDHDRPGTARGQGLLDEERLLLVLPILLVGSVIGGRGGGRSRGRLSGIGLVGTLGGLVLEREVDGLLEVELDGGALPLSLERG